MSNAGKTLITFIFTATPDQAPEGERLFASHAKWIAATHHRDGELKLVSYNTAQGPQLSNPLDPSSAPTENTMFTFHEVYDNHAGLADHWGQAGSWEDFGAFMDWAQKVELTVLHGSPIVHSAW